MHARKEISPCFYCRLPAILNVLKGTKKPRYTYTCIDSYCRNAKPTGKHYTEELARKEWNSIQTLLEYAARLLNLGVGERKNK